MAARSTQNKTFQTGAIGGDGASLHLYASSNQDMISLSYEPSGTESAEDINSFGIYWINDLKAHLATTEKENHLG